MKMHTVPLLVSIVSTRSKCDAWREAQWRIPSEMHCMGMIKEGQVVYIAYNFSPNKMCLRITSSKKVQNDLEQQTFVLQIYNEQVVGDQHINITTDIHVKSSTSHLLNHCGEVCTVDAGVMQQDIYDSEETGDKRLPALLAYQA